MDENSVILHPLSNEKSLKLMESENKLIFVVSKKSTKEQIKRSMEKMFKVKVVSVNTMVDPHGIKKAYIKFSKENPAIEIATQLGLM